MGEQLIGKWVLTDQGRKLEYSFKNSDGTAFDLTGASAIKLRARPVDSQGGPVIERTGNISGAAALGKALFSDLTNGAVVTQGEERLYEAEISFTKSAEPYFMPRFQYAVQKAI